MDEEESVDRSDAKGDPLLVGTGTNECSDSDEESEDDENQIEDRPPLRPSSGSRAELQSDGMSEDACALARKSGLLFFAITIGQAAESGTISKNWKVVRKKGGINCLDEIKKAFPEEHSIEYKMLVALAHKVYEAETLAGTRKWRVGVIPAKDLQEFQTKLDGLRIQGQDGVESKDRTVWHIEGAPGYETVIGLDLMGQQAGKLLGYLVGADKTLVDEEKIEGIEHAQLQFRKAPSTMYKESASTTSTRFSGMGMSAEWRKE